MSGYEYQGVVVRLPAWMDGLHSMLSVAQRGCKTQCAAVLVLWSSRLVNGGHLRCWRWHVPTGRQLLDLLGLGACDANVILLVR